MKQVTISGYLNAQSKVLRYIDGLGDDRVFSSIKRLKEYYKLSNVVKTDKKEWAINSRGTQYDWFVYTATMPEETDGTPSTPSPLELREDEKPLTDKEIMANIHKEIFEPAPISKEVEGFKMELSEEILKNLYPLISNKNKVDREYNARQFAKRVAFREGFLYATNNSPTLYRENIELREALAEMVENFFVVVDGRNEILQEEIKERATALLTRISK